MLLFWSIKARLKVIDEICPSPTALKLMITRLLPSCNSVWSGSETIDGLKNAADSIEYSWVKYDPIRSLRYPVIDLKSISSSTKSGFNLVQCRSKTRVIFLCRFEYSCN